MPIVSIIFYAITDIHCCFSSNIHHCCCTTCFAQIEIFFIQCYDSTVSLGYPPACNEAIIYLSTTENAVQKKPSWKCIFLRLGINPWSPEPAKILAQVCNAVTRHPIELESYRNHPRIQQVFCFKSKKSDFSFRFGVRLGDRCKWWCFCFFLATFTWP